LILRLYEKLLIVTNNENIQCRRIVHKLHNMLLFDLHSLTYPWSSISWEHGLVYKLVNKCDEICVVLNFNLQPGIFLNTITLSTYRDKIWACWFNFRMKYDSLQFDWFQKCFISWKLDWKVYFKRHWKASLPEMTLQCNSSKNH
jgi:hypothetical protein